MVKIVESAIKYTKSESLCVVTGKRHHDCFQRFWELYPHLETELQKQHIIQGFITTDLRFVNREEAGVIAFNAKQTPQFKEPTKRLFSEDLY